MTILWMAMAATAAGLALALYLIGVLAAAGLL
jgi:hypothetical protein